MAVNLHARARADMLSSLATLLSGGRIRLYAGQRPQSPKDAPGSTLLAEVTFQDPAHAEGAIEGVLTLTACEKGYAVATGNAQWFRCVTKRGLAVLDGDCGEHGDLSLARSWIEAGDEIAIAGLTVAL